MNAVSQIGQTAGSPSGVLEEIVMVVIPPHADRVDLLYSALPDILLHTGRPHANLSFARDRAATILGVDIRRPLYRDRALQPAIAAIDEGREPPLESSSILHRELDMPDHVLIYLNGQRVIIDGDRAFRTLVEFLREDARPLRAPRSGVEKATAVRAPCWSGVRSKARSAIERSRAAFRRCISSTERMSSRSKA